MGPNGEEAQLLEQKDAQAVTVLLNKAHEEGIKAGKYLAALKRSEALKVAVRKAASEGRKGGRPKKEDAIDVVR